MGKLEEAENFGAGFGIRVRKFGSSRVWELVSLWICTECTVY